MAAPNPDADPDTPDDLPDDAVEARWADIVAQLGSLDAQPGTPGAPAPDATTDDRPGRGRGPDAASADQGARPGDVGAPPSRATGPRDWPTTPEIEALEEAESHFVPPEPEPVLSRDPLLVLAWSVLVGVPVLTVVLVVVRSLAPSLHLPAWLGPVGGAAFLVAVTVLLWRMPHRRDPEDDDTGAVV